MPNFHDVILPKFGMTMTHATILEWLRSLGDEVIEGEPLATIITDKVEAEIMSPANGILAEILFEEDQDVPVGEVMARIESQ